MDNLSYHTGLTGNVSSPRRLHDRMLSLLMAYARHKQIINVTPFILSGAMGPVSILGTVAQLNAEALAGIAGINEVPPGGHPTPITACLREMMT